MDGEDAGYASRRSHGRKAHRKVIEMAEMNYLGLKLVEYPSKSFFQGLMYVAVLVVRHVDPPHEDFRHELICLVPRSYVGQA